MSPDAGSIERALVEKFSEAKKNASRLRTEVTALGKTVYESGVCDLLVEKKLAELTKQRNMAFAELGRLVCEWERIGGTVSLDTKTAAPREKEPVERPTLTALDGGVKTPKDEPPKAAVAAKVEPAKVEPPVIPAPKMPPSPTAPAAKATARPPNPQTLVTLASGQVGHAGFTKGAVYTVGNLLKALPKPEPVRNPTEFAQAVATLSSAVDDAMERWPGLPSGTQRSALGFAAAYAHYLQDVTPSIRPVASLEFLSRVFSLLSAYARDVRPGFVHGLANGHEPQTGEWLEDAREYHRAISDTREPSFRARAEPVREDPARLNPEKALAAVQTALLTGDPVKIVEATVAAIDAGVSRRDPRLVRMLLGHGDTLTGVPVLRDLRKAIRQYWEEELGADVAEDDAPTSEGPWKHIDLTRGKRAVLVGGDERRNAHERIRDAFEFAVLDWPSLDVERVRAIAAQVRSGSIDVVILLAKFCSHRWQEMIQPACKEKGIPFIVVSNGYGVSSIQRSFEAALGLEGK